MSISSCHALVVMILQSLDPLHLLQTFFPALALFLASAIMTRAKNIPMPDIPRSRRMRGRRMAHMRSGKNEWAILSESRNGYRASATHWVHALRGA